MACFGTSEFNGSLQNCTCPSTMCFFKNHDLYKRGKEDPRPVTHLEMSGFTGGQVCMSCDAENDRFLDLYAYEVSKRSCSFMIEMKTEFYPFFIDIDEKRCDVAWRDVNRFGYVCVIQKCMKRFFDGRVSEAELDSLLQCIMCAPEKAAKPLFNDDGTSYGVKIGLHLHFPNLIVDKEKALLLRASCIAGLQRAYPFTKEDMPDGWDGVIDSCVYEANGLRMLESLKFIKCECKSKVGCENCQGTKKLAVKFGYQAKYVIDGSGKLNDTETERVTSNLRYALSRVSIRTREGAAPHEAFRRYEGCPSHKKSSKRQNGHDKSVHLDDESGRKGIFTNKAASETDSSLDLTEERVDILKRVFKRLHDVYDGLEIRDAVWKGDSKKPYLCVRVDGEGSSWCRNKGGDHQSNTVWFLITSTQAQQRCFCSKEYKHGCCRKYASPPTMLTQKESVCLFEAAGKRGSQTFDIDNDLWPMAAPPSSIKNVKGLEPASQKPVACPIRKRKQNVCDDPYASRVTGCSDFARVIDGDLAPSSKKRGR